MKVDVTEQVFSILITQAVYNQKTIIVYNLQTLERNDISESCSNFDLEIQSWNVDTYLLISLELPLSYTKRLNVTQINLIPKSNSFSRQHILMSVICTLLIYHDIILVKSFASLSNAKRHTKRQKGTKKLIVFQTFCLKRSYRRRS